MSRSDNYTAGRVRANSSATFHSIASPRSGRSGRSLHTSISNSRLSRHSTASSDGSGTDEDVYIPSDPPNIDFGKIDEFIEEERKIAESQPRSAYSPKFAGIPISTSPSTSGRATSSSSSSLKYTPRHLWDRLLGNDAPQEIDEPTVSTESLLTTLDLSRFSFFSAGSQETLHAPDLPSLVEPGRSISELFVGDSSTWWLDCVCPTDSEMKTLSRAFGIHPLTAEDIRMQETREKVELFRNYYFVSFHTFEPDKESEYFLEPINFYAVVFGDGILTFHYSPITHPASVRRRVRQLRDYVHVSADWICYALIDDITDEFAPAINGIEHEADAIEDAVLVARNSDFALTLHNIGHCRHKVMTLMRLLSGKADVIKMFAKRCQEVAADATHSARPRADVALYLGDIQDHIVTMFQNLLSYEKILSRSHANYLAQLQVQSFNSSNRMTEMFSKVTLIGTILVPLMIITGLFGMNVKVPGKTVDSLQWFFGIVGVMVACMGVMYYFSNIWVMGVIRDSKQPVNAAGVIRIGLRKFEGGVERAKSVLSSFR